MRALDIARLAFHRLSGWRRQRRFHRQERRLSASLSDPRSPAPLDSEEWFAQLQLSAEPLPNYGYDAFSAWRRGVRRAVEILDRFPSLQTPGARILEAGCGDAMLGALLAGAGHRVSLIDLEDRRDERARHLPLHREDLGAALPFEDGSFELVASYNTFEHLAAPNRALTELIRVVRPGGWIYLSFGPLYWSAWGLHAHETIQIPYVHLLFSEEFVDVQLQRLGIRDLGGERQALQPLNRWRLSRFEDLFRSAGCRVDALDRRTERRWLHVLEQHPQCLRGRGLEFEDLAVSALDVALQKPGAGDAVGQ